MSATAAKELHAVLLAGGSGTRLWPLSTQARPKQFLEFGAGGSLLAQSAARVRGLIPAERLWVVCGSSHAAAASAELRELAAQRLLIEPMAKNTLAAIALAAIHLRAQDPEAVMAVLPADHYIPEQDWPRLHADLRLGAQIAREERALVTFGIPPTRPDPGYGYLERGETYTSGGKPFYALRAFHEKPAAPAARAYLEQGGFYWNSGIFVWSAQVFMEQFAQARPAEARAFEALAMHLSEAAYAERAQEVFSAVENISVDYGLMEKAEGVRMVPASFAWDDVGALSSFEKILPVDVQGNHTRGEAYLLDSSENLVLSSSRPVVMLGVRGLIVVETDRAVLVLPKERSQDVKKIVEKLKKEGREDLLS